ncbi:glucokinase [Synechococcus elongatus]|uniref:Glucokinase n=1 Tax=Synechococcus elongatus PCC 11802 TaxID=2283154 RepID=A0AAT9JYW4_SYNEL|nr:glucokinase [Synechococcus elongatus]QFZ91371.1 glucokinase [Synechococcus elongatus PCC 11802]
MTLLLAGDIGGTKTNLLLAIAEAPDRLQPLYQASFASAAYSDLVPMVQEFLAAAQPTESRSPVVACFGIAGPVVAGRAQLTNLPWHLSETRLAAELGIPKVALINDFAAIAYGLPGLTDADQVVIQTGEADPAAPIAILGAGTGLGEGFIIPTTQGRQVFSSEGSHADFAPQTELESELLHFLRDFYEIEHVSVERVVSGQGIAAIYAFLRDRQPEQENPALGAIATAWQTGDEQAPDLAAAVSQAALSDRDPLALQAMRIFVSAYGAEAGNLALKLLSYGGVYVAGGIAGKILPLLTDGTFLRAFQAKGRVQELLTRMPVTIVTNHEVGLIGAGLHAAAIAAQS